MSQNRFLVRPESETAHEFWLEAVIFEPQATEGTSPTRIIRLRDVTVDILNRRNTRSFGEAITHKIRTPVTHIVASLDLLARLAPQLSEAEIIQFSSTALHGAQRLHDTLDRILRYANLHGGRDNPDGFVMSGFGLLVEKVSLEIGIKDVTISVSEDMSPAKISLSLQSLEVLLWEILGNSRKFHPANTPKVTVEVLRSEPQFATIRISDNGIKLSPKQLANAWLPYYQGEKDFTGEVPGMGLGLSTVSTIVWGAGGSCKIMNAEAEPGVLVELSIPLAHTEDETFGFVSRLAQGLP